MAIEFLSCNPTDTPTSQPFRKSCLTSISSIYRVGLMNGTSTNPFNTATETNNTELTANITTEATWTAAIGLGDENALFMSCKFSNTDTPKAISDNETLPDGEVLSGTTRNSGVMTLTAYGYTQEFWNEIVRFDGTSPKVVLISRDGKAYFKELTDTQVDDDEENRISASSCNISTPGITSGQNDQIDLRLTFPYDEMFQWAEYDVSSFIFNI